MSCGKKQLRCHRQQLSKLAPWQCAFGKFLTNTLGKMSAGNGQMAAKDGSFHIVALWFHCLHVSEMHDCGKSGLTVNADFFDPRYQIRH